MSYAVHLRFIMVVGKNCGEWPHSVLLFSPLLCTTWCGESWRIPEWRVRKKRSTILIDREWNRSRSQPFSSNLSLCFRCDVHSHPRMASDHDNYRHRSICSRFGRYWTGIFFENNQCAGRSMYIGEEVAGIPANTALTLNCFVLYNTSIEYRNAFRRQLRAIPYVKRLLPNNKVLSLSFETTIVKSQSS